MPRAVKLKVIRTPIEFHDAFVAAPSREAAIAAWGSDKAPFGRGEAEEALDGEGPGAKAGKQGVKPKDPLSLKPRPSRAALDEAQQAIETAPVRCSAALEALAGREAMLARDRRELQKAQAEEMARLKRASDQAAHAYEEALRRWRG